MLGRITCYQEHCGEDYMLSGTRWEQKHVIRALLGRMICYQEHGGKYRVISGTWWGEHCPNLFFSEGYRRFYLDLCLTLIV